MTNKKICKIIKNISYFLKKIEKTKDIRDEHSHTTLTAKGVRTECAPSDQVRTPYA
jgi:hypothetical protein